MCVWELRWNWSHHQVWGMTNSFAVLCILVLDKLTFHSLKISIPFTVVWSCPITYETLKNTRLYRKTSAILLMYYFLKNRKSLQFIQIMTVLLNFVNTGSNCTRYAYMSDLEIIICDNSIINKKKQLINTINKKNIYLDIETWAEGFSASLKLSSSFSKSASLQKINSWRSN